MTKVAVGKRGRAHRQVVGNELRTGETILRQEPASPGALLVKSSGGGIAAMAEIVDVVVDGERERGPRGLA
jgi:hypothetical protein